MDRIEIICKNNGKRIKVPIGSNLEEIMILAGVQTKYKVMGALVNNKIMSLSTPVYRNKSVEFIDLGSTSGMRIYVRSLIFVLYKAVNDVVPGARLRVEHPISTGYYIEISIDGKMIGNDTLGAIKNRMREIVAADMPFEMFYRPTVEIEKMFRESGAENTANLLRYVKDYYSIYYTLDGLPDFYQSLLTPSTGCLDIFDLVPYFDGFFLCLPSPGKPDELAAPCFLKQTFETFKEYWSWCRIMGITDIADINKVKKEELNRLINEERAAANNKLQQATATKTDTVFLKPDCPPAKVVKGIKSHVAFGLGRSNVSENQIMNVLAIADYMKQFPESKAVVTGYADNATGSHDLNLKLARKRAEAVAKMLQETYGIDGSRLTIESMKNKEQPFQTNDWNRVVIIVAD